VKILVYDQEEKILVTRVYKFTQYMGKGSDYSKQKS